MTVVSTEFTEVSPKAHHPRVGEDLMDSLPLSPSAPGSRMTPSTANLYRLSSTSVAVFRLIRYQEAVILERSATNR